MRAAAASLFLLAAAGCVAVENPPSTPSLQTRVVVDERIELMSVIQLLSGYQLTSNLASDYKKEAGRYFSVCSNHAAVTEFANLSAGEFNFSVVPDAFIALSQPPALIQRFPAKDEVVEAAGGSANYEQFINLVRNFAAECDFAGFHAAHRGYYHDLESAARPAINASTNSLVTYLGMPLGSTEVVLGPLLHDGGFATRYVDENGDALAFAFIGPVGMVDGRATFGSADRLQPLVAHEFAHTVVNPLTSRYAATVSASEQSFALLVDGMRLEGYASWEQVVNENIIRAITARLTALDRGDAAGRAEVADDVRRGFAYVPALVASLEKYESDRITYSTLAEFYPDLLRVFVRPSGEPS